MNIADYVARNGRKYANADALLSEDTHLNWQQLDTLVNQMAHCLRQDYQVGKGDRVALLLPNSAAFVIAYFAVIRLQAIVVPINVKLTSAELDYILGDAKARCVISCELTQQPLAALTDTVPCLLLNQPQQQLAAYAAEAIEAQHSSSDNCAIIYTSGTTGRPKGVLFQHQALIAVATMFAVEMQYRPESRLLNLMPFTHSAPLHLSLVAGTMVGCCQVVASSFSPDILLTHVAKYRTTHFFGAPVAYLLTAQHPAIATTDLSSMSHWIYGGGPMSPAQAKQVQQAFASDQFYCVYGLTEAGPTGTLLFPEHGLSKAGSIGKRAALNTEIRLVDDQQQAVAPGEAGEIELRGEGLMREYWRNPAATSASYSEAGWLKTGDIAVQDDDGFYWIKDRKKDLIISGGVNVYPREVEEVLSNHPSVQEVAVIGIPHEEWGESVKAVIMLVPEANASDTENALKTYIAEHLASYKHPRLYSFVDDLPRNANGKVLKHKLRQS